MGKQKPPSKPHFDWNTLELETAKIPKCDHVNCDREGVYPAPKSLTDTKSRYYFCLEHVKAYNLQWDFNEQIKKAGSSFDATHTDPDMPHKPFRFSHDNKAFKHNQKNADSDHQFGAKSRTKNDSFYRPRSFAETFHDPFTLFEEEDDASSASNTPFQGYHPYMNSAKSFSPKTPEGRAFKTLGLSWPFTRDSLKSAYKRLAKQHHPDLNQQSSESLEKFREIKEAFELLQTLLDTVYGTKPT